jgi:hypothetical protein
MSPKNPSPAPPTKPPAPPPPLLRRVALSASPSSRRSGGPHPTMTPVLASPRHLEAPRAPQFHPEPLQRREFVKETPPVSCAAAPIPSSPADLGLP